MILLATLNARYIHSALGLRYLKANMGELYDDTRIIEFTINQRAIDIAEQIIQLDPHIVGFGLYIWNIQQSSEVLSIIKALRPDITIVLGGPEISHETEHSPAFPYADYVIRGQADHDFARLCQNILEHTPPLQRILDADTPAPTSLALPYQLYNDEDIRNRVIYVEASRGCPFKCEFCLSALDKTSKAFDIDLFLEHMEQLYQRGARHFKFVDRTFNLNIKISERILRFFLEKPLDNLFLHFELIPDRLPNELKQLIEQFPAGALQFEIGIQSFNPQVQALISRVQDSDKTAANLQYLTQHTGVHLHTDLIAGLPGEDLQSFGEGFDRLIQLGCQEIQMGILKRLRGTPIIRHTDKFELVFNPNPPYTILQTRDMDSDTLFRINRFARYWDLVGNSGRFKHSLPLLLGDQPFNNFMKFSDWLHETTAQTHKIALPRLFQLLYQFGQNTDGFEQNLQQDYQRSGIKTLFAQLIGAQDKTLKSMPQAGQRQKRYLG